MTKRFAVSVLLVAVATGLIVLGLTLSFYVGRVMAG